MASYDVSYSETAAANVVYTLLELPPALLALVEDALENQAEPLVIKGQGEDEAVLCTKDSTHALRACRNSNSLLLCAAVAPDWDAEDDKPRIRVDATLHQTLECTATRPKTERLDDLLGGQEWTGEDERPTKRIRRYSRDEVFDLVQASDAELEAALDAQKVLEIDGNMRKVDVQALAKLLSSLLQTFSGNSIKADSFDFPTIASLYADEAELPAGIANKVVTWFAKPRDDGLFELDIRAVAKEIGLALLDNWKFEASKGDVTRHNRIPIKAFEQKWQEQMSDSFASECSLKLLEGHFILNDVPEPHLVSVPAHSLPLDPAARFAHLFSLRQKWLPADMIPFLDPIAVDAKERDRWVLKHSRKVKVTGGKARGVLWVAR